MDEFWNHLFFCFSVFLFLSSPNQSWNITPVTSVWLCQRSFLPTVTKFTGASGFIGVFSGTVLLLLFNNAHELFLHKS